MLWATLWPTGVVRIATNQVRADGSLGMKFGWWRGAVGQLAITGRRLDALAPPMRADIPDGYGDHGFQSTGLIFPTEGCWEVTGSVGDARLSFVTRVIKAPSGTSPT